MRLGILGGTFDPIHLGHLRAAEEIGQEMDLEKVYLIPSASPPHKTEEPLTQFRHRMTMATLAVGDSSLLDVQDLEGNRPGLSYSIETLREFHNVFGPDLDLFFILGVDAFLEIKTWKEYQSLFHHAHFVVIERPGYPHERLESLLLDLCLEVKEEQQYSVLLTPSGNSIMLVAVLNPMDISSTQIRKMVAKGKSIHFLVPESVRKYIIEKGLYKDHADYR